jgi:peptide chain release factor 3
MLLDCAKGVETQTRKLFRVCRQRSIPMFTFVNKMDRPGRDAFSLVGEVESVLGIGVYPITWPIFRGGVFRGVYHRLARRVHLFEEAHAASSAGVGAERPPVEVTGIDDPALREALDDNGYDQLRQEAELLDAAGDGFDRERFEAGMLSPMFFGSAINNFGLEPFLDTFSELMPPPRPRASDIGPIAPTQAEFSGFVFKIQANMDKAHRDRVAFVRICSGRLSRGMTAHHVRTGRAVRLANPTQFLARERSLVEDGYAGDVVGIHDPGTLEIGDTLTAGSRFTFEGIPSFAPEHFTRLALIDPLRRKQFAAGLEQLAQEGTVQLYRPPAARSGDLILGALGQLQFEVVKYRLESEYRVAVRAEPVPYQLARWVSRADGQPLDLDSLQGAIEGLVVLDVRDRVVALFDREWALRTAEKFHPELRFAEAAVGVVVRAA